MEGVDEVLILIGTTETIQQLKKRVRIGEYYVPKTISNESFDASD